MLAWCGVGLKLILMFSWLFYAKTLENLDNIIEQAAVNIAIIIVPNQIQTKVTFVPNCGQGSTFTYILLILTLINMLVIILS